MALLKRKPQRFEDLSRVQMLRKIRKMQIKAAMNEDMRQNREFYEAWPNRLFAVLAPGMMLPAFIPVFLMAPEWFGVATLPVAVGVALSVHQNRLGFMYRMIRGKVALPESSEVQVDLGELRAEPLEMSEDR